MHGKIIYPAEGEKFRLAGRYSVSGPHDPILPAEHSINCHCMNVPIYSQSRGHGSVDASPFTPVTGDQVPSAGQNTTQIPALT
jgi:hypothetical protein